VRSLANDGEGGSGGVVADIAKLRVGREEYYTRELATDHEAYLSGHGESPGRWYGAGAATLGLQGEASVAEFQAMFEGRDPTTGELLGRPHGRNAVPAFDVVLRPTKSVSVLYGLGDPATGRHGMDLRRNRLDVTYYEGTSLVTLRQPEAAQPVLDAALAAQDPEHLKARSIVQLAVATSYAQQRMWLSEGRSPSQGGHRRVQVTNSRSELGVTTDGVGVIGRAGAALLRSRPVALVRGASTALNTDAAAFLAVVRPG
jgi:hypothetical protein